MITLTYSGTTVELPDDLYWSDEHDWQAVEQSIKRSITGALIVENAALIGGRPITLGPIDEQSAWLALDKLNQVLAWAFIAGCVMSLSIRGTSRNVIFNHPNAVSAKPVIHYSTQDSTDYFLATLKFLEI